MRFSVFFYLLVFPSGPYTKCRTIDKFEGLHTCKPYLNNQTLYFNPYPENDFRVKSAMALLQPGLSEDCASNLFSLFCRSWFRECGEARGSGLEKVVLPSLMVREAGVITPQKPNHNSTDSLLMQCRSECEKHRDKWKNCTEGMDTRALDTIRQQAVSHLERFMELYLLRYISVRYIELLICQGEANWTFLHLTHCTLNSSQHS
jgi:hypothetical protein